MGQWISVQDRLPECEKCVLICTRTESRIGREPFFEITCGFYEDGSLWSGESKISWFFDALGEYDAERDACRVPEGWLEECITEHEGYECAVIGEQVIAWMPLPEPPKDEAICSINGAACCECVPGAPCAKKTEGED